MQTLWSMVLHRFGLVRQKHYDELAAQYSRLTDQYITLRHDVDNLLTKAREGGRGDSENVS